MVTGPDAGPAEPPADCPLCPRLVAFRRTNRETFPDYHNAPVRSFGNADTRLLIVGLAPGLHGANRTGRPFTGDYAGDLLYETLTAFDLASGQYAARADDGLTLVDCRITNVVRCLPPENKPTGGEANACRPFLAATIGEMTRLQAILALGKIAHDNVIRALGGRLAEAPFGHGARHEFDGITVFDSYHCSRYNTNTRRLTPEMFRDVVGAAKAAISAAN